MAQDEAKKKAETLQDKKAEALTEKRELVNVDDQLLAHSEPTQKELEAKQKLELEKGNRPVFQSQSVPTPVSRETIKVPGPQEVGQPAKVRNTKRVR